MLVELAGADLKAALARGEIACIGATTPEEYKLHELKTSGTTSGTNEIFTSISLKSGLVLRATEDSKQSMDVEIAKIDKSNAIHYKLDVTSRFEMVMVAEPETQLR